jgi:hypothetical protein
MKNAKINLRAKAATTACASSAEENLDEFNSYATIFLNFLLLKPPFISLSGGFFI